MESSGNDKDFIVYSEGLKRELRNSWLSNGRQESVADHSWRLALMAIVMAPKLQLKLNMGRLLQLAIIHDMGEIEVGDIPTTRQNEVIAAQKAVDETHAFVKMRDMLGDQSGDTLLGLWREYEEQETVESRVIKALDRLECVIQKNQQEVDQQPGAAGYFSRLATLCEIDPYLEGFYQEVLREVHGRDMA